MHLSFWHALARTWGAVAFFHPYVQEDGGSWEDALVSMLADAEAVVGEPHMSDAQVRVLELLLSGLGDSATRLVRGQPEERSRAAAERPEITRQTLEAGVEHVRVRNWFDFSIAPGYFEEWHETIRSTNDAVEAAAAGGASALLLDFRETRGDRAEDAEMRSVHGLMRSELAARLFAEPVRMPGLARVQRVGYADPTESGVALGGYGAEWVTQVTNAAVQPRERSFRGPIVVLTGAETCSLLEPLLVLLQGTGRAACVGRRGYAYRSDEHVLPLAGDVSLRLRRHAQMHAGRPARYSPTIATDDALGTALGLLRGEITPSETLLEGPTIVAQSLEEELPSRGRRILGAIKLWTAMREFYPVREHLEEWDTTLPVAVGAAAEARTREEYFRALQELSSSCRGGHNFVLFLRGGALRHASRPYGYAPRIRLVRDEGRVRVVGPADVDGVRRGDVLEAVDGEPVAEREERLSPLFPQYPSGARDHYLLQAMLDSPEGAAVGLRVRADGREARELSVRALASSDYVTEPIAVTTLPPSGLLSGEFGTVGYLDASRISQATLAAALEDLESASALIVDLRRYPLLHIPAMSLPGFIRHPIPNPPMLRPVFTAPERRIFGWIENRFYETDEIRPAEHPDRRPMAALIGGGTVSLGEDWARALKIGCGAVLVGGVTAGGVGSNAWVNLPGGGRASFSGSLAPMPGLERSVEGNGIVPDVGAMQLSEDEGDMVVETAARTLLTLTGQVGSARGL